MSPAERQHRRRVLFGLLSAGLAFAVMWGCNVLAPSQQGWDESNWGPLVPHETFPGDCSLCHVPERWDKLRDDFSFDHAAETGYELKGAHQRGACLRCHNDRGPVQEFLDRGCGGCHLDFHEGTLGIACDECHNERSWRPEGIYAEHNQTRFPLFGSHLAVACDECHHQARLGSFEGAPVACEACHQDDLGRALDPDHVGLGWVNNCQRCHTPSTWNQARFDHNTFPLVGAHARADCTECHVGGVFAGTPRDCLSCHQADYQGTTDPNHVAGMIPTNCEQCHTSVAWEPARFNHLQFPLRGAHARANCSDCHLGGVFVPLPTDCFSCHQTDYQATTNPNHMANGFPTTCQDCHSDVAWVPATFNHQQFPLTGRHAQISCTDCHLGGVFGPLPTDCFSCHQADYQGTTNPNHVADGYPTTCQDCHTTTAWQPSTFDHNPLFPLNGNHNLNCIDCHTTGSTLVFSCTDCHEHRKSEADKEHKDVTGYVYNSAACFSCHPRGSN